MYKFIGLAMLGVFAMMVIPGGNFDTSQGENMIYGMATIVKNDSQGNEVFQQSIHNQLTNAGEDYILEAVFNDGVTAAGDTISIGAICVSDDVVVNGASGNETLAVGTFDSGDGFTEKNCKQQPTNGVVTGSSLATIGPLQFISASDSTANVAIGDTINSIGICQNVAANDLDYADCATGAGGGILFAVVSVTATQLNVGETVDITYEFNLVTVST